MSKREDRKRYPWAAFALLQYRWHWWAWCQMHHEEHICDSWLDQVKAGERAMAKA